MQPTRSILAACLLLAWLSAAGAAEPPAREMEKLSRGVVAISDGKQVFVSWRLLGTEPNNTRFDVYRSTDDAEPVKLNDQPLSKGTCFVDGTADLSKKNAYSVRVSGADSTDKPFTLPAGAEPRPYLALPIATPEGYSPNDCSAADLDGDGDYEIIVHQVDRPRDNSHGGETGAPILQAYRFDGKQLWSINLGRNIREGAHYTQFMVYDLDGDGRAEVVCKTADGTTDAAGKIIGDPGANHADKNGYILKGPEFLSVFDGLTGKELATTRYIPARHPETDDPTGEQLKAVWGDGYGNRCDRFLACVAYLDGVRPSVVMCRGYYTRTVLAAWDWRDGKLTSRWVFDSDKAGRKFTGQGNHNLSVADVDGDGKDEIIYGAMCINADGSVRYSTDLGHGDAIHVGDLNPGRPGIEVYRIQEPFADAGAHLFDANTGEILWKRPSQESPGSGGGKREGPGRGLAANIDPRYPGSECWSYGAGILGMVDVKGEKIAEKAPPSCNFAIWWDGDELRELLDKTRISKWRWETNQVDTLLDASLFDCRSNNGTKSTPALSADLIGDWREEVIFPTNDGRELRIFTTTIPTERRMYTLMHDPQYRLSVAWQNVGYNQPPHPSFYIDLKMPEPPKPRITLRLGGAGDKVDLQGQR
jgi:rhamnogalacturonan endolyase